MKRVVALVVIVMLLAGGVASSLLAAGMNHGRMSAAMMAPMDCAAHAMGGGEMMATTEQGKPAFEAGLCLVVCQALGPALSLPMMAMVPVGVSVAMAFDVRDERVPTGVMVVEDQPPRGVFL